MATKKQRRRRAKDLRHEYEYVYIDEEGNEIEVEQPPAPRKERERKAVASKNGRPARGVRPVKPPNFRYMRKQALVFYVILLAAFLIIPSKGMTIYGAALLAAIYSLLMMPVMWMMQRTMYRSYLKRTGKLPPPRERRPK
jgi:hypothetical protein